MENAILKKSQSDQLIFLGVLLFFLGLITGLAVPAFPNPRMGLSSHIEGVLNGMLLIIIGLIWHKVDLSRMWLMITFWLAVYGAFANWFGILVAAVFNAGKILTVAANGQAGPPLAEAVVVVCLISLTIAMLVICVTILIGLFRNMRHG